VPSTSHAMALLRLLVRSATGGELTHTPRFIAARNRPAMPTAPKEMHIVLVDNAGRKCWR
jgi:L-lactate dehydrogenase complex protein LldF